MCLAADVALIESGTTGFNGQVQVIKKGKTACYDCTEKEVPKSYPVCTIRSTPSQPIHCIVWAKSYLLPELFGLSENEETPDQLDTTEDADNVAEIKTLEAEAQALKRIRESMGQASFAQQVFDKVFNEDIERLRGMEDMWKTRRRPISLDYATLQSEFTSSTNSTISSDQNPWNLLENFSIFQSSLDRLSTRFKEELETATKAAQSTNSSATHPAITFDKDDADTLDFVTSTSNIRSHIFSIPLQSKFTVKQMAGNIIPAIATTNAMTAGLCVLQSFKVLRGDYMRAKMLFLESGASGARAVNSEPPRPPNPECAVCGVANGTVEVDIERATLGDLVQGVLRGELGYGEELTVMNEDGMIYDPDMDDMLAKRFAELGVKDESFLTVVDDEEVGEPRVNLVLAVKSRRMPEGGRLVVLAEADGEDGSVEGEGAVGKKLEIGRKARKIRTEDGQEAGSGGLVNGAAKAKTKRTADEAGLDELDTLKRKAGQMDTGDHHHASGLGPVQNGTAAVRPDHQDEVVIVDDAAGVGDGAIVIGDDDDD